MRPAGEPGARRNVFLNNFLLFTLSTKHNQRNGMLVVTLPPAEISLRGILLSAAVFFFFSLFSHFSQIQKPKTTIQLIPLLVQFTECKYLISSTDMNLRI